MPKCNTTTYVVSCLLLFSCRADSPSGEAVAQADLHVRNAHGMAYDLNRDQVLLFGGADTSMVCADTWTFADSNWQRVSTDGPPERTFPAICSDPVNGGVLLFGGNRVLFGTENSGNTFLDDFWRWDGVRWHRLESAGPAARAEAGMAFDPVRKRLVLFGGYNRDGDGTRRLNDTWEWDGKSWQQVSDSGPAPQNGASLVFDPQRNAVLLFGQNAERSAGEVWRWHGVNWQKLPQGDGPRRYNAAIAFARDQGFALRFGGWSGDGRTDDTWIFDDNGWRALEIDGPAARNHAAMVYDQKNSRFLLFGGHDGERVFGDMWAFQAGQWTPLREMAPQRRIENGH